MDDITKNAAQKGGAFLREFKQFIARGNVMDLAVGDELFELPQLMISAARSPRL